jgi:hypothetical protein
MWRDELILYSICPKYAFPHSRNDRVFGDGFSINESDFMILERAFELHPATLQYSHQVMTASKFWDNNLQNLSTKYPKL